VYVFGRGLLHEKQKSIIFYVCFLENGKLNEKKKKGKVVDLSGRGIIMNWQSGGSL